MLGLRAIISKYVQFLHLQFLRSKIEVMDANKKSTASYSPDLRKRVIDYVADLKNAPYAI